MGFEAVTLDDKYDLYKSRVLVTGTQAVVRLTLMQQARDRRIGKRTAGYVTGYRGSPLGGLDQQFWRAAKVLAPANILFQPAINEDLAATALWGTQQAEMRGEGRYDGVFGIWYGKGPGVDRSGDALRHANLAGTSPWGGVLALMGDDHTCESSTTAHQSEFAFVDAMIPVLSPAGVQEIIDYGLFGYSLSRFAGVWVGIKCVKDTVESTAVIDGSLDRVGTIVPGNYRMPPGGLNIRTHDHPLAQEERLHEQKIPAVLAFLRANAPDRIVIGGGKKPRLGIATAGKSYLDVQQALDELGIDEVRAAALGVRVLKIACTWPLDPSTIRRFADGLERIVVVEEKRGLIEQQLKEILYGVANAPVIVGKKDESEAWLFPAKGALDSNDIAVAIGTRILERAPDERLARELGVLKAAQATLAREPERRRARPLFLPGLPAQHLDGRARRLARLCRHRLPLHGAVHGPLHRGLHPDGRRGCQLGRRGAVLDARPRLPESRRRHLQPLRQPRHPRGGGGERQHHLQDPLQRRRGDDRRPADGRRPRRAADRAAGGGGGRLAHRRPVRGARRTIPATRRGRSARASARATIFAAVQKELAETGGLSVLIYDQTCAAEKRRRRKRGRYPDPDKRVVINELVCEGCGDCGVQSNCVAIVPVETEFGRKRAIDQSSCNKDFSCIKGFCPSFVTVHGAAAKKREAALRRFRAARAAAPARPHRQLRDPGHRRRRHRRGDDRRAARHGRPSRGQGRGGARHGRPRPEGRRGDEPCAHRLDAVGDQLDPHSGRRCRRHPRLRHGGRRLGQIARRHRPGTHPGVRQLARDLSRRLHARRRFHTADPAHPLGDHGARRSRSGRASSRRAALPTRSSAIRSRATCFCSASPSRPAPSRCRGRRSSGRSSSTTSTSP